VAGMRNKEVWVNERRREEDIDGIGEEDCSFCKEERQELSVIAPGKRAPAQRPDDPEI